MQSTMQACPTQTLARVLPALALLLTGYWAHAQTPPLAPETVLVAASGAPAPTQKTFTISGSFVILLRIVLSGKNQMLPPSGTAWLSVAGLLITWPLLSATVTTKVSLLSLKATAGVT